MSSNLVIVGIPEEDDRVWKVSSEKVPHITILYLGDTDEVSNLDQIMLFVEHAANTSLKRFYLPVDRRAELGDGKADVLFFRKNRYDVKAVKDFRSLLLQDPNIKTAYDATSQFEAPPAVGKPGELWIPHLTLGYPDSPAKPLPEEWSSKFYEVNFDRIAVWDGDYSGPEFQLKDYWEEEMDNPMDVPLSMAMGTMEHHGVKGMRWGVRKDESGAAGGGAGGVKDVAKKIGKGLNTLGTGLADASFENRANDPDRLYGLQREISTKATEAFKRTDLPAIKNKPEHEKASKLRNRLLHPLDPGTRAYRKDIKEAYIHRLEDAANSMTNASQTRQYTIRERGWELPPEGGALPKSKTYWAVSSREIKHAAGDEVVTWLELVMDEDGFITDLKDLDEEPTKPAVAHIYRPGAEVLEHHGVKGMRWGVRKDESAGGSPSGVKEIGRGIKKAAISTAKFAGDIQFENMAKDGRAREAIINDAHPDFKKLDLPAIKAKPEHVKASKLKNRLLHPLDPGTKAYRKEVKEAYISRLEKTANEKKNWSKTREFTIRERGNDLPSQGGDLPRSKYYWEVSTRQSEGQAGGPGSGTSRFKHAAMDDFTLLEVQMDEDGFITGLKKASDEAVAEHAMAQTTELGVEFLEHFGVKGMKWGQRKTPPEATAVSTTTVIPRGKKSKTKIKTQGGENHDAHSDAVVVAEARQKLGRSGPAALSNKELRDVANRLQLEQQVAMLTTNKGQKFVQRQLEQEGQHQVQRHLRKGVNLGVRKGTKVARKAVIGV